jgi:oligopeptide/dipeptide ABC transporter ATP-binding protein
MPALLTVRALSVSYRCPGVPECRALDRVSFDLKPGEILGILGESGSGKSTLAAALLRLLHPSGAITSGTILFDGYDILQASPEKLRGIRGKQISMVFQEPSLALHPVLRIERQVSEVLRAHEKLTGGERRLRTRQALEAVFPGDIERIASCYPHQLSGGQRQRALIAQAIVCRPRLLIADEPTGSLDSTAQRKTLELFRVLRDCLGLSLILISHNPALLAGVTDRILVLYAGRVMEINSARKIFVAPGHPYTRALLRCMVPLPTPGVSECRLPLPTVPGGAGRCSVLTSGCRFAPRCPERQDICLSNDPELVRIGEAEAVSCFRSDVENS